MKRLLTAGLLILAAQSAQALTSADLLGVEDLQVFVDGGGFQGRVSFFELPTSVPEGTLWIEIVAQEDYQVSWVDNYTGKYYSSSDSRIKRFTYAIEDLEPHAGELRYIGHVGGLKTYVDFYGVTATAYYSAVPLFSSDILLDSVPLPSSAVLFGPVLAGIGAAVGYRRRKRIEADS